MLVATLHLCNLSSYRLPLRIKSQADSYYHYGGIIKSFRLQVARWHALKLPLHLFSLNIKISLVHWGAGQPEAIFLSGLVGRMSATEKNSNTPSLPLLTEVTLDSNGPVYFLFFSPEHGFLSVAYYPKEFLRKLNEVIYS